MPSNINAFVIRNIDGNKYGFMAYEDGKCVHSESPTVSKEQAQVALENYLINRQEESVA